MTAPTSLPFDRTSIAWFQCRCGKCKPVEPALALVAGLHALSTNLGKTIFVSCGVRCAEHNRAVGGASLSRHLPEYADAADIHVDGMKLSELYKAAAGVVEFNRGGIGIYPDAGFVHVDARPWHARWGQVGKVKVLWQTAWERLLELERPKVDGGTA